MTRAYRLALRPGSASRRDLNRNAWARRVAQHAALAWQVAERGAGRPAPNEFATAAWLRDWRKQAQTLAAHPDLALVPARVFEYVAEDLERAWKTIHKNAKKQGAPRHPAFEKFDPHAGGFATDGSIRVTATHIHLPRMAPIRLMPHRRPEARHGQVPAGSYSRARIVREHGEWFAVVTLDVPDAPQVDEQPTIGLDWGIRKLATLSDGTTYANPRALEQVEQKAQKARQSVARKRKARDLKLGGPPKKGERRTASKQQKRAQRVLARQHKRAADIRKNAIHHATKAIAAREESVAAEDLRPRNLARKRVGKGRAAKASLNRRILDAAPGMFLTILAYKLHARGRRLVRVNPAYTSQDCSRCACRTDCGSCETYTCVACGLVIDRDVNAAKNILARVLREPSVSAGWSARKKRGEQGKTASRAKVQDAARAVIREREGVPL